MARRAKSSKGKAEPKRAPIRKPPKSEGARVRDLEKRLAEAAEQLRARNHELGEAQEQQTATSEILRVISSSPTDLQLVLDTVVKSAARFCGADDVVLFRLDSEMLRLAAHHGLLPAPFGLLVPVVRGTVGGRSVLERRSVHAADVLAEAAEYPESSAFARDLGPRTILAAPLLHEGEAIGTIQLRRLEVSPFTDKQIALLQTFADQAVIAIENVRLFKELEARIRDLTATSEILRVISQSPTDVQPVFETVAANALRLCEATFSAVNRFDGELIHLAAFHKVTSEGVAAMREAFPMPPGRGGSAARAILTRGIVHIPDVHEDPEYSLGGLAQTANYRSTLAVPMLHDGHPIGSIVVAKAEVGPFPDSQIALLQTFADQAVIAVENVRLFTELQEKNHSLTEAHARVSEALDQQTATSEILRVISRSQTNVQPVFDTILSNALRLMRASAGVLTQVTGDHLDLAAFASADNGGDATLRAALPLSLHRSKGAHAMAIRDRAPVNITDAQNDPGVHELGRAIARAVGYHSMVAVPMLRHDMAIGTISATRREPGGFTDEEIAVLRTFADQAVIAIENVRLFKELEARTAALTRSVEQLTALGEVGRAVSSTLDLETVLTTIVSRAVELSGLDGGVVFEYDEDTEEFVQRVATETAAALAQARRTVRIQKGEGVVGRTALTLEPVQVPDITVPGAHGGRLRDTLIESGVRAVLAIPMVYERRLIGSLGVTRNRPGEFPAETIELLRTLATQSALAIQNARLFREIDDKGRQLEAASQHKSEFLANMSHELRTPLNAIIGFSEVLNERMFGELNEKQSEYLKDIYASGQHLLSLINDILDLSKIEAGRMELEAADFDLPSAIDNALILVRERATRRGITLGHEIDNQVATIRGDERKVKQVLLNLLSNALKFTPEGGRIDVRASLHDGFVDISVTDTGVGIAPEDQEKVFEEFRQVGTADKKVEGTGLGLALSRRFVELHRGRIWVESALGKGSTFTFRLPVGHGE
jgi:two-component system, NtrC family, sensor kinase